MNITSTATTSPDRSNFGFWARRPLAQKLLLAFGATFLLAVVIAIVTLNGSSITSADYEDALTNGIAIRSISDRMTIELLSARRDGKDYLLHWRSEGYESAYANYTVPFLKNVEAMRASLKQLAPFGSEAPTASIGAISQAQYEAEIAALSESINSYEASFLAYVDATQRRGSVSSTNLTGLEGDFTTAARELEEGIPDTEETTQLTITLLQIRRYEKNYFLRADQAYIDEVQTRAATLHEQIRANEKIGASSKAKMQTLLDNYLEAFDAVVLLDKELAEHDAELSATAITLQDSIARIESLGEQLANDDINRARANNTQTFTISVTVVFIVLAVSVLLSLTLSQQITQPVVNLTNTAQQIADGNFDAHASVNSADEVGTLAQTFNSMTERLRQAFEDIRRRALAVQTSAEVSQRLSVATDPRQLAVEVVEQVQAAFKYYHAHIYFLDEETGDLIMAGGTGEAGAKMLANKHKVAKGRGLVGRAAASNAPVLVSDVSQAEGWLPNALLPETRSEVAIPISSGNQVLGVLDVQQNQVNGLDQEDVTLLQSLAGQVAISLQNARAFERSKSQAELESLVNSIGQKIQAATTVDDTLQVAIREIGIALGASRVMANIQSNPQDVKVNSN